MKLAKRTSVQCHPTHLNNLNLKDDGNEMKTTKALFHLCIVVFYVKKNPEIIYSFLPSYDRKSEL